MKTALLLSAAIGLAAVSAPAHPQARFSDGGAQYSVAVVSWRDMPFRTVVRQQYDFSCGSAALASLLTYHYGRPTTEAQTFKAMYDAGDQAKIRKLGFSLLDMKRYLDAAGLRAEGYRMTLPQVAAAKLPAIVLIQTNGYKHFVVLKGVRGDRVVLGDPAFGVRAMSTAEFAKEWNGVVFAVAPELKTGRFNVDLDWDVRPGAPMGLGVSPVALEALTREFAPLYQISAPAPAIPTGTP